jgi:hypothetical protein
MFSRTKRASRSRRTQPSTLKSSSCPSLMFWLAIYCATISSVTLPELQQKYPRAHRCRPQNCFFTCGNSAIRWCAVFPFSHCTNRLIVTCGGIDTNRCTWSFDTCPFMIRTSCCAQISRIRSRVLVATSPFSAGRRYFVIHTKCKWISNTVCAPRRYSGIHPDYPAARVLKPSPVRRGF